MYALALHDSIGSGHMITGGLQQDDYLRHHLTKEATIQNRKIQINVKLQGKVQSPHLINHHTMKLHGDVGV